ncbi:MAG: YraN family protein [Legionellales bacterium RIFCSPHIGHO2_12_FULL_42_9]|nr:MAG: YraN family protein [Legionellales bacterium RIFCSPHIGHO2_12_FULL_42_9]
MSIVLGMAGEEAAKKFLMTQGLSWIASNYHCRFGEIDLIMQDGDYLVFIEVRQRRSMMFGGALASITDVKQKKLIKSVQHYQLTQKKLSKNPCRIDVLTLQGTPPKIDWIKNAIFGP